METNQDEKEVKLFQSSEEFNIEQICSILSDNNIPFIRKDYGSGSYMTILMGQSNQEKAIFVNQEDYEKASKLISIFISQEDAIEETQEEDEDDDLYTKRYIFLRHFWVYGLVLAPVLIIIISLIICICSDI